MSWLLDTNVLSELRKGGRADAGVTQWVQGVDASALFLSAITIGEVRQGIERIRRRDTRSARTLERWLSTVVVAYGDRILNVDVAVAERWGALNVADPLPLVDGLVAATALVHGLTVVTRNSDDFERAGVEILNPFSH